MTFKGFCTVATTVLLTVVALTAFAVHDAVARRMGRRQ